MKETPDGRPRLVMVVTHPMTALHLLRGQLQYLREAGFDVHLVTAAGPGLEEIRRREGVEVHEVPFEREIRVLTDVRCVSRLVTLFRELEPDIVNCSTPKAGLLGLVAARVCRVPCRIYSLRGLRMETARGLRRFVLRSGERLASRCATDVISVSESLLRKYVESGFGSSTRTSVLGNGSSNGVDIERFSPHRDPHLRSRLGIPEGTVVIGFVGRLTRDKGVSYLVEAFRELRANGTYLLLVGPFEKGDPLPSPVRDEIQADPRIVQTGYVDDSAAYYGVMDLLALPSLREGFPNAPLEAAASGLPVVGFRATGTVDAVVDGETGTLVAKGDGQALGACLERYVHDPDLRAAHGQAGRRRVQSRFTQPTVWRAWADLYRSALE